MKNQKVINELKRIAKDHDGILLPEIVVREAHPSDSPLHPHFEWDNNKAADSWRVQQARQLIRVCVVYEPRVKRDVDVFVSLTTDRREGGYRVLSEVMSDAALRAQALADAVAEMEAFTHKYQELRQLGDVFTVIRKTVTKLKGKPNRRKLVSA